MTSDLELRQALLKLDKSGYNYLLLAWDEGDERSARVYTDGCTYDSYFTLRSLQVDILVLFLKAVAEGIREQAPQRRIAR